MRRLLTYTRKGALRGLLLIIVVAGTVVSVWMAWGDSGRLSAIALTIATATFAYLAARAPLDAVRERNEAEVRNRRAQMCEEPVKKIIDLLDKMLLSGAKASKVRVPSAEVIRRVAEIRKQIIVQGSADLVQAWQVFFESVQEEADTEDVIKAGEVFFRTLRKSIGHDDSELPFGMLTAIYLTREDKQMALKST